MVTDECIKFGADKIKDAGTIELEAQYLDYDPSLTPVTVDQVIMGNVIGASQGQNVTRQAMIKAGIPKETCATSVNKICASGTEAVALAYQAIRSGDSEVVLAGGMEILPVRPHFILDHSGHDKVPCISGKSQKSQWFKSYPYDISMSHLRTTNPASNLT